MYKPIKSQTFIQVLEADTENRYGWNRGHRQDYVTTLCHTGPLEASDQWCPLLLELTDKLHVIHV